MKLLEALPYLVWEEEPKKEDFVIAYKGSDKISDDIEVIKKSESFTHWYDRTQYLQAKAEHQKTWYPVDSLKWKDCVEESPEIPPTETGVRVMVVLKNSDGYIHSHWFDGNLGSMEDFPEFDKWCYASEYEAALAQEKKLCALGEGWEKVTDTLWTNKFKSPSNQGSFTLDHDGEYFALEHTDKDGHYKDVATWHESICTVQMVLDVMKEVNNK